ncbi:ATP-binding protein [Novosphingobium sp. KA1]|nr:ATP-binding protein [Novosphingobium sp. KA1]
MSQQGESTADATPHASSLIQSLRDIGYSCETALADIMDNSITAGAHTIEILSELDGDDPALAVLDDGAGMTLTELVEAMRPGSKNPLAERLGHDLGRFGLGLKSASFSQCKRLTVASRKDGVFAAATWDLDEVAITNRWEVGIHSDPGSIPWADRLPENGTLVIWRSLDRLSGGLDNQPRKRAEYLNRAIASAERHIRLVFHRFMTEGQPGLAILLNGRELEPIDPFGTRFPSHQSDRPDRLELGNGAVEFQCFTLPHHKSISKIDWEDLGGPEGHLRTQGFYVYRGRRLIIAGSWLGLARQTELTKLCRIRVDIPNTMDADWKIDVKKASAQLPFAVRERMRLLVERLTQTSKRTYRGRGQKLVNTEYMPVWQRVQKDGAIIYSPDPAHPVFADFSARLPVELQADFASLIGLIGSTIPIPALHADFAGCPEEITIDEADVEAVRQMSEAMVPRLLAQGTDRDRIPDILRQVEPFHSAWAIAKPLIDTIIERETGIV